MHTASHWPRALLFALLALSVAGPASAQDMNLALSRLRYANPGGTSVDRCARASGDPAWCGDDDAYRGVMTEFAGSMIPPVLTPAGTRGVRGIYVGFETWITGIDHSLGEDPADRDARQGYWFRAVEGDGIGSRDVSRFADDVLVWGRFNVRKGLPFGFELGTSIAYLANTSYFALGAEIRWSLFEGFREGVGWIPDIAFRGAVQTLVGDGEVNVTVPSVDVILSSPFVVANTVEISPWIVGQVAFPFVDSELVDLTPETSPVPSCNPSPLTPDGTLPSPYCTGPGSELNENHVFPSLRSTRWRLGAGLQLRYEWLTILGGFMYDVVRPSEVDASLLAPTEGRAAGRAEINRQWQVDLGLGVTL